MNGWLGPASLNHKPKGNARSAIGSQVNQINVVIRLDPFVRHATTHSGGESGRVPYDPEPSRLSTSMKSPATSAAPIQTSALLTAAHAPAFCILTIANSVTVSFSMITRKRRTDSRCSSAGRVTASLLLSFIALSASASANAAGHNIQHMPNSNNIHSNNNNNNNNNNRIDSQIVLPIDVLQPLIPEPPSPAEHLFVSVA